MTDPAAREREVTEILDEWDWVDGACLVGGYAVSAYGKPRYSRDLDFVMSMGVVNSPVLGVHFSPLPYEPLPPSFAG